MIIFWSPSVMAADFLTVVIDKITWMGNKDSHSNEWIELYNNSSVPVVLDNWKLIAEDGSPEINLIGEIAGQDFFLLERSDDETVPEIEADLIYTKSLNNDGESLKLINEQGKVIDEVNCSAGWFAGDNETKQTMKRKSPNVSGNNPDNWQTGQNTTKTKEAKPLLSYSDGIVINEVLPSPEGPDADNEWIEFLNQNDFAVDLSGWKISDTEGKTKIYVFPEKTNIKANSFLLLSRTESKVTLNNNGDGIQLIQPDGNIIDNVNWGQAAKNQSYGRTESGWKWISDLTPNSANAVLKITKTNPTKNIEKKEPKISSKVFTSSAKDSSFSLSAALVVALLSGGIIIFLKRTINQA